MAAPLPRSEQNKTNSLNGPREVVVSESKPQTQKTIIKEAKRGHSFLHSSSKVIPHLKFRLYKNKSADMSLKHIHS